ncbi:MAG: DUF2249 domain-containing protein [Rhodospirillales bacterium]
MSKADVTVVTAVKRGFGHADSMANQEIDLREIPHGRRHGLVFAAFDALKTHESFVIINDHDPSPLRNQMEFMRHGQVGWEYLEQGPEAFRVRITRTAEPAGSGPKPSGADNAVFTKF